jgi:EAL domain-containing protein (putative c-di-GMP-specific phosphodiesterase class I)
MNAYALYLRLEETARLERIHGPELLTAVRADIDRAFKALADSVLRPHAPLGPIRSARFGLWWAPFELKPQEIAADPEEQKESIAAAADEMARSMLREQLGEAVAMNLHVDLGILPVDGSGPEELDARIDALPRGAALPVVGPQRFRDVLDNRRFDIHLQPIVSLATSQPVGYEALVRGHADTGVSRPDHLFAAAAYYGLRPELELACAEEALLRCAGLPATHWLSVNLSPELFDAPSLRHILSTQGRPSRTIFEVTEHLPLDWKVLTENSARLRSAGSGLAVDDAGCGYANMGLIHASKPEIVKLCITVVRRLEHGPQVLAAVRTTVSAIQAAGALALAEGVETEEQARLARVIGCDLAQGYLFGRARPAELVLAELLPPTVN